MLQKASNVTGILTSLEIETKSSQQLTLAWPSLGMAGLNFRQPVPLFGPPSYIMLSMTKATFIAMYMTLCDVIPFIELIKEMREH
ncbi:LOW QUALITY PROTEIN: hypothetical protein ACHAW6_000487 [Cyclotella cf. meneghiniana]